MVFQKKSREHFKAIYDYTPWVLAATVLSLTFALPNVIQVHAQIPKALSVG